MVLLGSLVMLIFLLFGVMKVIGLVVGVMIVLE